jgi:hypothetical protein
MIALTRDQAPQVHARLLSARLLRRSARTTARSSSIGSLWVDSLLLQLFLPGRTAWNLPAWSLGIEMLRYALFPLLVWLCARVGRLEAAIHRSPTGPQKLGSISCESTSVKSLPLHDHVHHIDVLTGKF